MKTKKWMVRAMAAALSVAMLTGCGAGEKTAVTYENADIPKKLTIMSGLGSSALNAGATDNNAILSFQMMEELTGCHVEWIHPAAGSEAERFNLAVASGKLPDVIGYNWRGVSGGAASYVEDDVIIDITDMVKDYMPNFYGYLEQNPDVKKEIVNDNGQILFVPFIRKDKELRVFKGFQIREDWLNKLGLSKPTTTDELFDVLMAFKTQDPNGNGQADEIPMTGISFDSQEYGIGNLLWAFGTTYDFHVKDGKVVYGPMEDSFKEGLGYIEKLYSNGLIDQDYLLNDRTKMDSKVLNDVSGFLYNYQPTRYWNSADFNNGTKKVVAVDFLKGPGGKAYNFDRSYSQSTSSTSVAVTTANQNPVGTLRWLDNFYGGEGYNYMNFGEEGVSYEWEDGYPKLTDYVLDNPEMDKASIMSLSIGAFESSFPCLQDWRYYEQYLSEWGREAIEVWAASEADMSGTLPNLFLTEQESDEITQAMTQIETYIESAYNKVVIGQMSIDEWPSVCEKLKSMGIENVLKLYNDAYQRYLNK